MKKNFIFIVGFFLLAGLIVFVVYSLSFLVSKINAAMNIENAGKQPIIRINFEGLKKIGIIK